MLRLIVDKNQIPIKHQFFQFPDRSWHVNVVIRVKEKFTVTITQPTLDNIFQSFLLCDAIQSQNQSVISDLYIPFMPYSRQDRRCTNGDPDSFRILLGVLSASPFNYIRTYDVHNPRCFNGAVSIFQNILPTEFFEQVLLMRSYDFIVCPDKGAVARIESMNLGLPIVYCEKIRCPRTGRLSGFEIVKGSYRSGDIGIIIDDICDGGGTFVGLAELFECNLDLAVSHGIFSKGLAALKQCFKNIYATNSYCSGYHDVITYDILTDPNNPKLLPITGE